MRVLLAWTMPVLGTVLAFGVTATARAAAIPVSFAQAIDDTNVFAYANNGAGNDAEFGTSTGGAEGAAIPIDFTFLAGAGPLPADLTGIQDATISMTSSTVSPVVTAFGGTFAEQPITGGGLLIDQISIIRDMSAAEGAGARRNLLTVTFTGNITGAVGGTTPSLSANSVLGDTVIYSSDFLSFAQSTQQDFNVALSSWDPLVTPPSGLGINADGYFNSATAAGVATFDFQGAATVIPEPSSVGALALSGMLMLIGGERKLRSRNSRRLARIS